MLTIEQKRLLSLAKSNEPLARALKREIADRYGLETWDKVDLKRAFEYENWRLSAEARMDDFFRGLNEARQKREHQDAVHIALHGFGNLSKKSMSE